MSATMTLSKMDILTTATATTTTNPTKEPATHTLFSTRGRRSTITATNAAASSTTDQVLSLLTPTFHVALQFRRITGAISLVLFVNAFFLGACTLYAARLMGQYSLSSALFLLRRAGGAAKRGAWGVWNSKSIITLRKKIVFEFFTLILGAGGNNVCLMIFWPGWWVLGFLGLTAWACGGSAK